MTNQDIHLNTSLSHIVQYSYLLINKNIVILKTIFLIFSIIFLLSGCAGFGQSFGEGLGKGITSAVLDKSKSNDLRTCRIWSKGFKGISHSINQNSGKTKILMVHGVGQHEPGYSTIILENLAKELGLDVVVMPQKNMTITDVDNSGKDLGNLRLTKVKNKRGDRELLFYELTWSSISEPEKEVLSFDQSGLVSFRRTDINHMLKKAANDAVADPLVYLGSKQQDMQVSVSQSYCWLIGTTYSDFPDGTKQPCKLNNPKLLERAKKDKYIFITHSLGSRITIDALQRIARLINNKESKAKYPELINLHEVLRRREITIFMLSNQLQLLQLGRPLPEVVGQANKYCNKNSEKYKERFADKTNIIALSDPNDVLSYAIPQRYKDKYLDSRMCSEITNVNINIANIMDLLGMVEVANPIEAHTAYHNDARVISLIAHGVDNDQTSNYIQEKCTWIRTDTQL